MSIFAGVSKAEVTERNERAPDGEHLIEIEKVLSSKSQLDGTDMYIVEYRIVESTSAQPGRKYSWVQHMKNPKYAFPALKQFAMAVCGANGSDKDYDSKVEANVEAALEASCTQAFFNGKKVRVTTRNTKTKAGFDFVKHTFRAV
jgi:hypothetical protein